VGIIDYNVVLEKRQVVVLVVDYLFPNLLPDKRPKRVGELMKVAAELVDMIEAEVAHKNVVAVLVPLEEVLTVGVDVAEIDI
jgi:hypothetical protein